MVIVFYTNTQKENIYYFSVCLFFYQKMELFLSSFGSHLWNSYQENKNKSKRERGQKGFCLRGLIKLVLNGQDARLWGPDNPQHPQPFRLINLLIGYANETSPHCKRCDGVKISATEMVATQMISSGLWSLLEGCGGKRTESYYNHMLAAINRFILLVLLHWVEAICFIFV